MRSFIISFILIFGLGAGARICPPGIEEVCSDSDSLNLSGSVETFCDVSVTADPKATELDLTNGEAGTKVATINEATNNPSGYVTVISSANDGKLVNMLSGSTPIDYQLSYDGGPLVTITAAPVEVFATSQVIGISNAAKDLEITFAGRTDLEAGTYNDELTITMTAN